MRWERIKKRTEQIWILNIWRLRGLDDKRLLRLKHFWVHVSLCIQRKTNGWGVLLVEHGLICLLACVLVASVCSISQFLLRFFSCLPTYPLKMCKNVSMNFKCIKCMNSVMSSWILSSIISGMRLCVWWAFFILTFFLIVHMRIFWWMILLLSTE